MNAETKELLTLAAKAMGFEYVVMGPCLRVKRENSHEHVKAWWPEWNPLTSADDLVEMECQHKVWMNWEDDHITTFINATSYGTWAEYFDTHNNSRRAARAMASLRVVAEIGRRMT